MARVRGGSQTESGKLTPGSYGPYTLRWLAKDGVWKVSANTLRAIRMFKVGVTLGSDPQSKVFGTNDNVVRRAAQALKAAVRSVQDSQRLVLPEIFDLEIKPTSDGLIKVMGHTLPLYRELVAFKSDARTTEGTVYDAKREVFLKPERAEDVLRLLKAEEDKIRNLLEFPLPSVKWAGLQRNQDMGIIFSGPLLVFDGENIGNLSLDWRDAEGNLRYYNSTIIQVSAKGRDHEALLKSITDRVREVERIMKTPEFENISECTDEMISRLQPMFADACARIIRDGPWLLFQCGYHGGVSHELRPNGWRWCYRLDAWGQSLLPLSGNVGVQKVKGWIDEVGEVARVLASMGINHRSFRRGASDPQNNHNPSMVHAASLHEGGAT